MIIAGDALECLRLIPAESAHCCVTSPPYYGLRDYGVAGQVGLEPTPEAYVARMVEVFREVRRVLRSDGTLWLNLGDSYASNRISHGVKPKDLLGIPWMLAFALRADGWYLRQDIIWAKPNPMPESITDRCTKAHEYLFLLTKADRYFYDAEAIKEPSNKRSVWTVARGPYKGAHFATFPPDLIEPCILAGTSERGVCPKCSAQWARVVERKSMVIQRSTRTHAFGHTRCSGTVLEPPEAITIGWRPTCSCNAGAVPATVIDPFFGAGTTGVVAQQHGRDCIGIELNPAYALLAHRRIEGARPIKEAA